MTSGRLVGDRLTELWGPVALVRRGGVLGAVGIAAALLIGAARRPRSSASPASASASPGSCRRCSAPPAHMPGIASGVALGAVSTMGYVGFLGGPPIIGGLAELTSLPTALWLLVALGAAIATLAGHVQPAAEERARTPRRQRAARRRWPRREVRRRPVATSTAC